jgi:hypothetical protein
MIAADIALEVGKVGERGDDADFRRVCLNKTKRNRDERDKK